MTREKLKMKLAQIKSRCNSKSHSAYKYYGGRGIKCLLTVENLEFLWDRDKANELKRPSIDRIDPDKNYCLENCRFVEMSENVKNMWKCYHEGRNPTGKPIDEKSEAICLRADSDMKRSIEDQAGREKLSVSAYLLDLHQRWIARKNCWECGRTRGGK